MKERDSYLNLFEKQENTISDCVWANGARGSMCLSKQGKELLYRFLEMPNGMDIEKKKDIKKYGITGPIVADGIVARWIYRRPHTPLQTIYAENSVDDSQSFIRKNQSRPDMEGKILFQKAYEYCIKQEADKIRTSYWVFSFVSEDDQAMLRSLIDGYLLFLYKLAGMENLDKTLDLQVLRHIANGRGRMLPEGMEDYIFNATCDRLERKGYIKVGWVEGHTPEDVRLLDKGKAYLKQIERKMTEETSQETIELQTESDCSEENDEYLFWDRIENKPILALTWKLMQLDGAEIKEHGDKVIVQKILELITGLPYNSCKKVWEVGNRPIKRKAEDIAKLNQYMKSIGMKTQL